MENTLTPINTEELLKKLQQSSLTEEQKNKLTTLMSRMSEDEKRELATILKKEEALRENFEADKKKQLTELNKKTSQALKETTHHAEHEMRQGYENFDNQQESGNLKKVEEAFLQNKEINEETVQKTVVKTPIKKTNGSVLKFILALAGLATVAGILMLALSNL